MLSHESGLRGEGDGFALDEEMGLDYVGVSQDDVVFVSGLEAETPAMDHALYLRGSTVRARPGTLTLGEVISPYFSRTWEHFSSHAQTPPNPAARSGLAAITLRGRVAYLAHPLFRAYQQRGRRTPSDGCQHPLHL